MFRREFKKTVYERATVQLVVWRGSSGQSEYVSEFKGYTYNLVNGNTTVDQLTEAGHFREKVSNQVEVEKYTMLNVRVGSIIDYQYTIQRPFSVGSNLQTWHFQQDVPVKWSEYRLTTNYT